jgi:hypothetical protein
VFAKHLSNLAGCATGFTGEAGGRVSDARNINLDSGSAAFTRRHRFFSPLSNLPFGPALIR